MELQFTHSAQRDLVRLREFIADRNPRAAQEVSQRLVTAIKRLVDQPRMGVPVSGFPGVRDLVAGDYVVRYLLRDNVIHVLYVWHEKENR